MNGAITTFSGKKLCHERPVGNGPDDCKEALNCQIFTGFDPMSILLRFTLCFVISTAILSIDISLALGQLTVKGNPWSRSSSEIYEADTYPQTIINSAGWALNGATIRNSTGQAVGTRILRYSYSGLEAELSGHDVRETAYGFDMNTSGSVVGTHEVPTQGTAPDDKRAAYWGPSTQFVSLASANATGANFQDSASAINDSGVIVGSSYVPGSTNGVHHAVRWDTSASAATVLGGLGVDSAGNGYASAIDINSSGNILGSANKYASDGSYLGHVAVRWNSGTTTPIELETVTIDSTTAYHSPKLFTDTNLAAGSASTVGAAVAKAHAVRWSGSGAVTVLDNLGSGADGGYYSIAYGLNRLGTVVGASNKYDSSGTRIAQQAVRWSATSSAVEELAHPSFGTDANGFYLSRASAVNLRGLTVGFVNKYNTSGASDGSVGAIWLPNGQFINANLINPIDGDGIGSWDIQSITSIETNGWVGGLGLYTRDGVTYRRGFVARLGLGGSWIHPGTGIGLPPIPVRWMEGDNWETGTAALRQGNARFSNLASHGVIVDEEVETNSIQVERGSLFMKLLGHRLTSREGLIIENAATVSVSSEQDGSSGNLGFFDGDIINQGKLSAGNSPGLLAVDGLLTNEGELLFELKGTAPADFDRIWLTDDLVAGGTLKLALLNGFRPALGDSFELMRFNGFDNQGMSFDFTQAPLDAGLTWNVSSFAADGVISVVAIPEPGGLLVMGSVFLGLLSRRTRRPY
jgi:hypothetical protein